MISECPCRYCDERNAECHSVCRKYRTWFRKNEKIRREVFVKLHANRLAESDAIDRNIKSKKRRGKIK